MKRVFRNTVLLIVLVIAISCSGTKSNADHLSPLKKKLVKALFFLKSRIPIELKNNTIVYIDLRIKNKIFYCTIENEFNCNENIKSIYSKE